MIYAGILLATGTPFLLLFGERISARIRCESFVNEGAEP